MSEPTQPTPAAVAAPKPHAAHEVHHEELGFWRKYVFSTDHKVIGIQYAVTGLLFLLFGFSLMMLMRWQLAYPGAAVPWLGAILGDSRMPGGTMLPEFYNELGAMHGTIMVFLGSRCSAALSFPPVGPRNPDGRPMCLLPTSRARVRPGGSSGWSS